jgi:amino acid efflux transporter
VGTAANILVWLFIGWEAVAQLVGDFRRPERDLPRAVAVAFATVSLLYIALALATIGVTVGTDSRVPLADLVSVGFGDLGRQATAVLAVALTMGTMNVYLGGSAKLAAALAQARTLPAWLGGDAHRSVPRRPLAVLAVVGALLLGGLVVGIGNAEALIRATSALFVCVYVLALLSAARILAGRVRLAAFAALALSVGVAAFAGWFLFVPAVAALGVVGLRRGLARRQRSGGIAIARARGAASTADSWRRP